MVLMKNHSLVGDYSALWEVLRRLDMLLLINQRFTDGQCFGSGGFYCGFRFSPNLHAGEDPDPGSSTLQYSE
jgi:hypothetical protein